MKLKILLISSTLAFSLLQTTPVFAKDGRGVLEDIKHSFNKIEKLEKDDSQKQQSDISKSKQRVNKEIDRRISALTKLLQRIQNDSKLTGDEKTNVSNDIQSDIDGLNALKTKVDADSDINTLKSDAKQVVTNFRVFAIATPKTRLLITIDNLQTVVSKITAFTPKLQTLIDSLKSQGKDVTSLQTSLDDINSRLTSVSSTLASDKTLILGVTTASTDTKSTFQKVRQDLAGVRQSLAQVRHDFAKMRETFRLLITGGNSSNANLSTSPIPSETPSPTPTETPSPTPTPSTSPTPSPTV